MEPRSMVLSQHSISISFDLVISVMGCLSIYSSIRLWLIVRAWITKGAGRVCTRVRLLCDSQRALGKHTDLLGQTHESSYLAKLNDDLTVEVLLPRDLPVLVNDVGWCIKVDMLADLNEHGLLDSIHLSPQTTDRVCQVLDQLASQFAINLVESARVLLLWSCELLELRLFLISHAQVQDFSILLLEQLMVFGQLSLHLFKGNISGVENIFRAMVSWRARLSLVISLRCLLVVWLSLRVLWKVKHLRWLGLLLHLLLMHLVQTGSLWTHWRQRRI